MNHLPRKTLTVEGAGSEILDHDVARVDQLAKNFLPLLRFGVERDAALVAVEHREIKTVDIRQITELAARDIAASRQFNLDHIGAEPCQELRAGRTRLHMGHVENANAVQGLAHTSFSLSSGSSERQ